MEPHRFLRNPFKLWDLEIARNHRSGAFALHRPSAGTPPFSIRSTASDLYPTTDCELLGNKCCLTCVTSQSALLGAGLQEHLLLHHVVSSAASGPRPASIDPATAGKACQSPSSLTSFNQLVGPQSLRLCPLTPKEPEISGIPSLSYSPLQIGGVWAQGTPGLKMKSPFRERNQKTH